MDDEIHVIQEFSELPGVFGIELQDLPNTSAIAIYEVDTSYTTGNFTGLTQFTQITIGLPSPGQFRVGSGFSSKVIFNSADDGKTVVVDYEGGGSVVSIDNINAIIGTLTSTFASITASNTSGLEVRASNNTSVAAIFGEGNTTDVEVGNKIRALSSAGILFESNSGTDVLTLGAGGGSGATFEGGVNIKGTASVGSGTETNPDLHKDGDTNTGIWFNTADNISLVTGGATRFRVLSTGQLQNVYESTVGTDYNTTLHNGYLCRAWVNFNGTGTVAIRASGNVSSITDNNTGDYTVNFTTAMPDANYSPVVSSGKSPSGVGLPVDCTRTIEEYSVSSIRLSSYRILLGIFIDAETMTLGVFR
jgi:hypothetical protein